MSDITLTPELRAEIERVKERRAAFLDGVSARDCDPYPVFSGDAEKIAERCWPAGYDQTVSGAGRAAFEAEAARRYPMPTVDVRRVWKHPDGSQYCVVGGVIHFRIGEGCPWVISTKTPELVRALADLLDNPTERHEVTP